MSSTPIQVDEKELGDLLGEYRGVNTTALVGRLIGGGVFSLGGVALVGWAIYLLMRELGSMHFDSVWLMVLLSGCVCIAGVSTLLLGSFWLRSLRNSLGLRVRLYTDGFAYVRRGNTDLLRWDDISEVTISPYELRIKGSEIQYQRYEVRRIDGLKVEFDEADMPDAPKVGQSAVKEVSRRLYPAILEAYERGEELTFGKPGSGFVVSKEGIRHKNKLLGWQETAGIAFEVGRNRLTIAQRGAPGRRNKRWATTVLAAIPNASVLSMLVEHGRSSA